MEQNVFTRKAHGMTKEIFPLCMELALPGLFLQTPSPMKRRSRPGLCAKSINCVPKVKLELDSIVKLANVEVCRAWLRQDQTQPEAHLVTNLMPIELGINY